MGYSFGYKMEGCRDISSTSLFSSVLGKTTGTCASGESGPALGSFSLMCANEGKVAKITTTVEAAVIMKGGDGGTIYNGLKAGVQYSIDVGEAKQISHIEFCFMCKACTSAPTPAPVSSTPGPTLRPTPGPTGRPSPGPTLGPTPATPGPTSRPTTVPTGTPRPTPVPGPGDCLYAPSYSSTYLGLPALKYEGNPNCLDMGYSFGYKMEGCRDISSTSLFSSVLGKTTGTCSSGESGPALGSFSLMCANEGKVAKITTTVEAAVIMKGGDGGTIYNGLMPGVEYSIDVGEAKQISHIEFCFMCKACTTAPTPGPTLRPTPRPTPGPTSPPVPGPTKTPTPGPTASPTPSPTQGPTDPPAPDQPTPGDRNGPPTYVKGDPHFKTFGGEMYDVRQCLRFVFFGLLSIF
jgi:hypothetical protein